MAEKKMGMKASLSIIRDKGTATLEIFGRTRKEVAGKVQMEIKKARSSSGYGIFLSKGISPKFEECELTE